MRAVPGRGAPLGRSRQGHARGDEGAIGPVSPRDPQHGRGNKESFLIQLSWRVVAGASYYDRVAFEMGKRPAERLELRGVETVRRAQRDEHDLVLTMVHDLVELAQ